MPWTLRMTLIFTLLLVVFMIYNTARLYWYSRQTSFQPGRGFWAGVTVVAVLFLAYPVSGYFSEVFFKGFSQYNYPKWVIYLFWYGLIFNVVLFSWVFIVDLVNLAITQVFRIKRTQIQTLLGWSMILITLFVFIFTATKVVWDTHHIKTENLTYHIPNGQEAVEPITIVHISEIHADRYTTPEKMAKYMDAVRDAEPDIILFTGDLISSGLDYVVAGADALASADPPLGTYAVMGDHDYWSGEDEVTHILEERGITVLRDESTQIEHGSRTLRLTGVTEIYSARMEHERLQEVLDERIDEDIRILFSHQATDRLINEAQNSGYHLLLAGHTHGGQIILPFLFFKFTAVMLETPYVTSHYHFDNMLLNINSGLGFTLSPVRYNAPAEVSVIEVK